MPYIELSIVLAAPGQSLAIVNLENLIFNGTIPKEWELSREPMYSAQSAQIAFTNSVVVTAQGNRVVFSESLMGKEYGELHISSLALRYVRSFLQLSYEAVGINPIVPILQIGCRALDRIGLRRSIPD